MHNWHRNQMNSASDQQAREAHAKKKNRLQKTNAEQKKKNREK